MILKSLTIIFGNINYPIVTKQKHIYTHVYTHIHTNWVCLHAQQRQRTRNYEAEPLFRRKREGVSIRPPRHSGEYKVLTSPYKSTNTLALSRRCANTSWVEVLFTVCLLCSQHKQLVHGASEISATPCTSFKSHSHRKLLEPRLK